MFNEEDILARLQKGENVDDIAQEVINIVNKANKTYEMEQDSKSKRKAEQTIAMRDILHRIEDYFKTYYTSTKDNFTLTDANTVQEVIEMVDSAMEIAESATKLSSMLEKKYGTLKNSTKTSDNVLANFLKEQGW